MAIIPNNSGSSNVGTEGEEPVNPRAGKPGLHGVPIREDVVINGLGRANDDQIKTLLSSPTVMGHENMGPAVREAARSRNIPLPTPLDSAPAKIDDLYLQRASLDQLGADPSALNAVKWDSVEQEPTSDGIRKIGVLGGERRVIGIEPYQQQAADGSGTPPSGPQQPAQPTIREVVENGRTFEIEVRPDGSEVLLGEKGVPRGAVSILIKGPNNPNGADQGTLFGGAQNGQPTDANATTDKTDAQPGQQGGIAVRRLNPGEEVTNEDGSISTERSITVTSPDLNGGKPTNIPTIWNVDGKITELMNNKGEITPEIEQQAVQYAIQSGEQWPSFDTVDEAVKVAQERSAAGGRYSDIAPALTKAAGAEPDSVRDILTRIVTPLIVGKAIMDDVARGAISGVDRASREFTKTTRLDGLANWLDEHAPLSIDYEKPQTEVGETVQDLVQGGVGMVVGAGATAPMEAPADALKAMPNPVLRALGYATSMLRWTLAGGVSDFAFFDPNDPGVGELAKELGTLDQPQLETLRALIADSLSKDLDDSEFEKRLKNVGGGVLTGAALGTAMEFLKLTYRGARAIKNLPKGMKSILGLDENGVQVPSETKVIAPKKADAPKPNVTVTGKELGDFGDLEALKADQAKLAEMRDIAIQDYADRLQGTTALSPEIGEIAFTSSGRKKLRANSANPNALAMIPKLREIVETAQPVGDPVPHTPTGPRDQIKQWWWMENTVRVGDTDYRVGVAVREDVNGKKFYNLNADLRESRDLKNKGPQAGRFSSPGRGGPSTEETNPGGGNVGQDDSGLNLYILGTAAAAGAAAAMTPQPAEASMAGDIMKRLLLGRAGRRALEGGLETFESRALKAPPPKGAVEALQRQWQPYKSGAVEGIDFNVKNFDTTQGALEQINNVSKAYEAEMTKKALGSATSGTGPSGRTISHALTRQVADLLGTDEAAATKAIQKLPVDTQDLSVRATVMRDTLVKMAEDIDRKALQIALDPLAVTDNMLLEFREDFARFAAFQTQMKGVQTEIARALSSFRIPASGEMGALRRAQIASEVLNGTGGREAAMELAKRWAQTPPELKGTLGKGWFAKSKDVVFEMWINGLLSSVRSHEVNFVGNNLFTLWQSPERLVAAEIGKVRQLFPNSDPDRVYAMEAASLLHGYVESIPSAFRLAWGTFKNEMPTDQLGKVEAQTNKAITAQNWGRDESSITGKFVDLVGQGVRLPGRALMTADEFNKATGKQAERRALAYRYSNQALDQGKSEKEAAEIYADVMEGKLPNVEEEIARFGDMVTFTSELGEKGKAIQTAASKLPGGRIILPFIRTPANIFKEATKRTPFAPILKEVRDDFAAGGARRDLAIARVSTGTAAMVFASNLAEQEIITGGGPNDPRMKREWMEKYQPYSINLKKLLGEEKFNALGLESEWYPYGRLDPISTLFSVAADYTQYRKWAPAEIAGEDEDALTARAVASVLKTVGDKAFLTGVGEIAAAYENPEMYGEKWLAGLAGSAMPFSSAMRDIRNAVDAARRVTKTDPADDPMLNGLFYGPLNEIKNRTPGWSKDLPPQTTFWGEDIQPFGDDWYKNFWAFSPKKDKSRPIDEEILRLRAPLAEPSPQIDGVKLNPWQHYNLKKAMNEIAPENPATGTKQTLREALDWAITTEMYKRTPGDENKALVLQSIRNKYADAARETLINPRTPYSKYYDAGLDAAVQAERNRKAAGLPKAQ